MRAHGYEVMIEEEEPGVGGVSSRGVSIEVDYEVFEESLLVALFAHRIDHDLGYPGIRRLPDRVNCSLCDRARVQPVETFHAFGREAGAERQSRLDAGWANGCHLEAQYRASATARLSRTWWLRRRSRP